VLRLPPASVYRDLSNNLATELPTVDEAGVPGYEYYTWFGLWAPKGTPQAIVEKM
jgi:tripartite-type tricarboxylate transporter receptor subunit TctC